MSVNYVYLPTTEMFMVLLVIYSLMSFQDDVINLSSLIQLILSGPEALKTAKATGKPFVSNSILTWKYNNVVFRFPGYQQYSVVLVFAKCLLTSIIGI